MKRNVLGLAAVVLAVAFSSFTSTNAKFAQRIFAYNQDTQKWEIVPVSSFTEDNCLSGSKQCAYSVTDDSFNPSNAPLTQSDINNAGSTLTPVGSSLAHYDF